MSRSRNSRRGRNRRYVGCGSACIICNPNKRFASAQLGKLALQEADDELLYLYDPCPPGCCDHDSSDLDDLSDAVMAANCGCGMQWCRRCAPFIDEDGRFRFASIGINEDRWLGRVARRIGLQ